MKTVFAAWVALFAAAFVPGAAGEEPCRLPPGEENFEQRTVTLPGGAKLTLAWIEESKLELGRAREAMLRERFKEFSPDSGAGPEVAALAPVDGFWIGVCEVTQKQWESVMGSNPSYFRGAELAVASQRGELPVECVSWEDCGEFCRRTGLRLPTEMEWQLTRIAVGQYAINPWSWTARNSGGQTHPAGRSYAGAGKAGLFDLDGNVCEWCADWAGPLSEGAAEGTERVVCGGCWCGDDWFDVQSRKERLSLPPGSRYNNVGFRVCLSPTGEE